MTGMEQLVLLAVVFFAISTVFSMIGMGGGILYVPILLFAGFSIREAPSISLILILATSLSATFTFWKNKKVDWKLALVIDPPTDLMALVGGYFAGYLPAAFLQSVLVLVLMVAGTLMLRRNNLASKRPMVTGKWWLWNRHFQGNDYRVNLPLVLTATAAIGFLSGMLGITGGIIKLPIMVLFCGVPMEIAVATSTVMVAATALSGLVGHTMSGQVDGRVGAILALGAILGGTMGSRVSLKLNRLLLKRVFGVAVWLIAIRLAVQLFTWMEPAIR